MNQDDPDLLAIDSGSVTAPAGCGKTQLIASALKRHTGSKPVLILTHTNAGVVALRNRLTAVGAGPRAYRIATIDGWAMRLIRTFPSRSAHDPVILELNNPPQNYPDVRTAAASLLAQGHINDILCASYSRLIVDEYQDCSVLQHAIVSAVGRVLPTCVLGDPLQAIFGFGRDLLTHWDNDVCTVFPVAAELDKPWRWINAGAEELGRWLLGIRELLLRREGVDIRESPPAVQWIELDGTNDHRRRLAAARVRPPDGTGRVLIIADSKNRRQQQQVASQIPGAVTVEAVDLSDLVSFARTFRPNSVDALERLMSFASQVMTNVRVGNFKRRVDSLARGTARKSATVAEETALAFLRSPSHAAAAEVLGAIARQKSVRTHRPVVLRACLKAMQCCADAGSGRFLEAAIRVREQNRLGGRPLPKRAVGSTLLLKGLEAEFAVVLDAQGLDAKNLYVAMTRGSKGLTICSTTPMLNRMVL